MGLYKMTDCNCCTYSGTCQWGPGVEHTAPGGGELCTDHWLHAYGDKYVAVLMDPCHGGMYRPKDDPGLLWRADGDVGKKDLDGKIGCTRLKTIEQIKKPEICDDDRFRFMFNCLKTVCTIQWVLYWITLFYTDRGEAIKKAGKNYLRCNDEKFNYSLGLGTSVRHALVCIRNYHKDNRFLCWRRVASSVAFSSDAANEQHIPFDIVSLANKAIKGRE